MAPRAVESQQIKILVKGFEVEVKLNAVTARLLELIDRQPELTGRSVLDNIAEEMHAPDPAAIVRSGATMLERLRERGIVLGTLPQ